MHVAEPGYGVALLNDSTYGHDVDPHHPRGRRHDDHGPASLVRAPRIPDPEADQGTHRFTYALLPGATIGGRGRRGLRAQPAAAAWPTRRRAPAPLVVAWTAPAVAVEAVKLADDRSGDVVVRLYESLRRPGPAALRTGFPVARAEVTDLLERPLPSPQRLATDLRVNLRPFQILTLRLSRGA